MGQTQTSVGALIACLCDIFEMIGTPLAQPSNLLPEMYRSPERYLTPDERDFFAVYLRPGQPW